MEQDIRWEQRLSNYRKALQQLSRAVDILSDTDTDYTDDIDNIIQEALIKRFEYTHELAWNVMKDYAEYQGNKDVRGSRDATREAFKMKLINNENDASVWLDMIQSRNLSSHTYNEETSNEIVKLIIEDYYPLYLKFEQMMEALKTVKQNDLFER